MSTNEYMAKYMRTYRQRLTEQILDHYGRVCVCCGETIPEFLTIDHINDDGYTHRKNLNGGTKKGGNQELLRWIIRNNYPDTIRVLCWNCNCGRARTQTKECPHITQSSDTVTEK